MGKKRKDIIVRRANSKDAGKCIPVFFQNIKKVTLSINDLPSTMLIHLLTTHLVIAALEGPPLVLGLREWYTELEKLDQYVGKLLEEDLIIGSIALDVRAEALVLDERHVGGQHHEALGLNILVLFRAVPLLPGPLLLQKQLVVVVGQSGGREGPGTVIARAVGVAATERMGTGQGDHFLVVEAHATEDGADVLLVLGSVRETAVGSAVRDVTVGAAGAVGDLGALHLLDGGNTGKNPEIRVGDPRELLCRRSQYFSIQLVDSG